MRTALALTIAAIAAGLCNAESLHVPSEFPTIQAAVDAAVDGDEIVLAPAVYEEAVDLLGKQITVRGSGGPDVTVLSGVSLDRSIITATSGETTLTVLQGLALVDGPGTRTTTCGGATEYVGGAVLIKSSDLTIVNCRFDHNGAERDLRNGGAVYAEQAIVIVESSTFVGNEADRGAGIYTCGASMLRVTNSEFSRNRSASFGGAICNVDESGLVVKLSTFHANEAAHGGGVYAVTGALGLDIAGARFVANVASHGGGLSAMAQGSAPVTVAGCEFEDNYASHGGGASISSLARSIVTVAECSFQNRSSHGGGVKLVSSGAAFVRDCDFTNNFANFGGGLSIASLNNADGRVPFATVEGCRFVGNAAGFAGGIHGTVRYDSGLQGSIEPVLRVLGCAFASNVADGREETGVSSSECYRDGDVNGRFFGGAGDLRTVGGGQIELVNVVAFENSATLAGGFHLATCDGGAIDLVNTTVADNSPSGLHVRMALGGLETGSRARVSNGIAWGNGGSDSDQLITEIEDDPRLSLEVRYSLVQGGFNGEGVIDRDPRFVNAAADDYRVGAGSPAIDAADNARVPNDAIVDLGEEPRFVDDPDTVDTGIGPAPIVDMGAHEFQGGGCLADLDGDHDIDADDFFAYLDLFIAGDPRADIDGDGDLDAKDFFAYLDRFAQPC